MNLVSVTYWDGQKVCLVFFHKMTLVAFSCLEHPSKQFLLDCIVTDVISVYIKKNQNW